MKDENCIHKQYQYTRAFLIAKGDIEPSETTTEQFRKVWWKNPFKYSSLNLSKQGYLFLKDSLDLVHYDIDLSELVVDSESFPFKDIMAFTKGLNGPWYIKKKTLILFDSKDATLISLYGPENFRKKLLAKLKS